MTLYMVEFIQKNSKVSMIRLKINITWLDYLDRNDSSGAEKSLTLGPKWLLTGGWGRRGRNNCYHKDESLGSEYERVRRLL